MEFLLRPISLFLIILLTFFLKLSGLFPKDSGSVVTAIALDLTIPATILCSFEGRSYKPQLLLSAPLFFLFTLLSIFLSQLLYKGSDKETRGFALMNATGYNIGSFALPVIRSFYGDTGVVIACIADIGNSLMVNGGTFALAGALLRQGDTLEPFSLVRSLARQLLSSPPFVAYLAALPFFIFGWKMPTPVIAALEPLADANSFVCMAMVGLSMDGRLSWTKVHRLLPILFQRFCFALITAGAIYFLFPFDQTTREILSLLCFSPIPGLVIANTRRWGGDESKSSLLVTASILVGMIEMLILAGFFQSL